MNVIIITAVENHYCVIYNSNEQYLYIVQPSNWEIFYYVSELTSIQEAGGNKNRIHLLLCIYID